MRETGVPRYFAGAVGAAEEFRQAAALASGSAVTHLALELVVMNHSDPAARLADRIFRRLNLAYAAAFSGLAIAACATNDKQSCEAAGLFGLVALSAATVGDVCLGR